MTINDLFRKLAPEDKDKVIIYEDEQGGWCNINIEIKDCKIIVKSDHVCSPFNDDK